jgi:plastocyanin
MRSLRLGLVGAVLLLLGATLAVWPARAVQKDVHVVMTGIPATPFAFSPGTQTASGGGDTVKWINDTPAEHTATSNDGTSFDVSIPASPARHATSRITARSTRT